MTQDEIIEMARQAHRKLVTEVYVGHMKQLDPWTIELLKIFAKQVEARYMQLFLDPENQPTQFGTATEHYREQEINDETEMCAEIVLEKIKQYGELEFQHLRFVLNDIYFKMKTRYES